MQSIKNSRIITKGKIALAVSISLLVTLTNYFVGNTAIPMPDEMSVLQRWNQLKSLNGWNHDSIPDDVLLIDVAYDKQLVDYYIDGFPVGQYVITNRQKLLDFLMKAKHANNYKYIMLDVIFEKGIESPEDSALFSLIASMNRIVIPMHEDALLQDSCLYSKAANADYRVTWEESNFARYQFIHDGKESIPLRMYKELNNGYIHKWGPLFFSKGWLCRNGIALKMPIHLGEYQEEGKLKQYSRLYLGADLLAMDSIVPIGQEIKDKIVVVGDFKDDVHDTYLGCLPGSIICLNAYYALSQGDHILLGQYGGTLVFYLIIILLYIGLAMAILNGYTLSSITNKPWLQVLLSLFSTNTLFWFIAIVAYLSPLDIVYNVWIPIGMFSLLDFFTNIYSNYKSIQDEKGKANTIVNNSSIDNNNVGNQVQNTISEPPKSTD